jgi:hypothetical protein
MRLARSLIRSPILLILLMGCVVDWGRTESHGQVGLESQGVTAIRMSACRSMQPDVDRILAAHAKDPALAGIANRLNVIDKLTESILDDLRAHQSLFLDQSLAMLGGADASDSKTPRLIGADKISQRYQAAFSASPISGGPGNADREVLNRYLTTAASALTLLIQSHGQRCLSVVGVDQAEIVRLSFILEMLAAAPDRDLRLPSPALPSWMSRRKDLQIIQQFAVESLRPRVAYALERGMSATTAPADPSAAYISFVEAQADAMLRAAKFDAALCCLRDGLAVAVLIKDQSQIAQLHFRIAEVLESTASASVAADEMVKLRSIAESPDNFGRASMMRLKYLLEAGEDRELLSEALADLKEPRCDTCLPQIIYSAWLACRRSGDPDSALPWMKQFLDRFPLHPLAAQMYFAAATDALAAGNAEAAIRLLQFIKYRFPQSKLIDRVGQLEVRVLAAGKVKRLFPSQAAAATNPVSN